jgi:hypothetical protein
VDYRPTGIQAPVAERERDVPTKFFHVKASHRRRKGFIQSLEHGGKVLMQEDNKVDAAFDFFNDRMGMPAICSHAINLEDLYLPHLNLSGMGNHSTEEEVWGAIQLLPSDKAPGPDGFTT